MLRFAMRCEGVAGTAVGNALGGQLVDGACFDAAMLCAGGIAAAGALIALRIP